MLLIGVTGGIASGKTMITRMMRTKFGVEIIDIDEISRGVLEPGTKEFEIVVNRFGRNRVVNEADGGLNRRALGDIVFNDVNERRFLERLVWPQIYRQVFWRVLRSFFTRWYIVIDSPLLFEAKNEAYYHKVIVVIANEESRVRRAILRDSDLSEQQVRDRIRNQIDLREKASRAAYVINNEGTDGEEQVAALLHHLDSSQLLKLKSFAVKLLVFTTVASLIKFSQLFLSGVGNFFNLL